MDKRWSKWKIMNIETGTGYSVETADKKIEFEEEQEKHLLISKKANFLYFFLKYLNISN